MLPQGTSHTGAQVDHQDLARNEDCARLARYRRRFCQFRPGGFVVLKGDRLSRPSHSFQQYPTLGTEQICWYLEFELLRFESIDRIVLVRTNVEKDESLRTVRQLNNKAHSVSKSGRYLGFASAEVLNGSQMQPSERRRRSKILSRHS